MNKEVKIFYELLNKAFEEYIDPLNLKSEIVINSYLQGGYNIRVNEHTFVSQYHIPEGELSSEGGMLCLALWYGYLVKEGLVYDPQSNKTIDFRDVAKYLTTFIRYKFTLSENQTPCWEYMGIKYSSDKLANDWIDKLLSD